MNEGKGMKTSAPFSSHWEYWSCSLVTGQDYMAKLKSSVKRLNESGLKQHSVAGEPAVYFIKTLPDLKFCVC